MKNKIMAIAIALTMIATTVTPMTAEAASKDITYVEADKVVAVQPTDYTSDNYIDACRDYMPDGYKLNIRMDTAYNPSGIICYVEKIVKPVDGLSVRLSTASGGYDDAYLTWDKSETATGYRIYNRRPSRSSSWSYLGRTTKTSYLKKDLYDGYKYEFRVIPYLNDKDGSEIYRVSDGYKKAYLYTLKKVSTPSVYRSGSKVKVRWSNISGESGYQISRSTSKTGTYIVSTYSTSSGTYRYVTASKGRTYYYKVRAYKNVTKNGKIYRVYAPWSNTRSYRR